MTLDEYQELAHSTAILGTPQFYPILGLAGEAGEVIELLKKSIRDYDGEIDQEKLSKEVGDVLWYVAETCTRYNLSLELVAKENLYKLKDRQNRNVIHGSGDNR